MAALFPRILFWDDPTPRPGPENFAVDELLLETAERESTPLLRRYRWQGHWVSFGYFQRWESVRPSLPAGARPVRRWTGGGAVDHGKDQTYSLLVPRPYPLALDSPAASYPRLHTLLATAISLGTIAPVRPSGPEAPGWCFSDPPAPGDLLDARGAKIAGAAQRRTVRGLLHQGSLGTGPDSPAPGDAWPRFAELLGDTVSAWSPGAAFLAAARSLAEARYASESWLRLR
jgi:lipoate-protein ligase A